MEKVRQEQFNNIADLRSMLLQHPDKEMVARACRNYLGIPDGTIFSIPDGALIWLQSGMRGTSSEAMFSAISGLRISSYIKSHPLDPSDFSRCYHLIKLVPEWKQELRKVAALSQTWKNIIDNWDKLCEMLENKASGMYDFMESIGC